jgi:NAD(P)-dependent dehydrogenase (short-subunit alcohol dehydrogenase family)
LGVPQQPIKIIFIKSILLIYIFVYYFGATLYIHAIFVSILYHLCALIFGGIMRLQDKVIVLTGATKGIGRGVAVKLLEEGAYLAASGRSAQDGEALITEAENKYPGRAVFVRGDIGDETYCENLINETVRRFGRLDGLVNNAGVFPLAPFDETDAETFDQVYAVNARGAFMCSKFAVRQMLKNGGGSIVHIGSTHAFGASPAYSAYGTSKGALYSLNSFLAKNYAPHKIRSNWITVGWVETELEYSRMQKRGMDKTAANEFAGKLMPLVGAMQTAADIAYGVIYLLSDESASVTESDLRITGGFVPGH